MVFWIVFSVIHILATLLLSTQLYYMGRWRLGKITTLKALYPLKCAAAASLVIHLLLNVKLHRVYCMFDAPTANDLPASVSDSGVLRRIGNVIYTDCIRQCSGPMYIVSHDH